MVLQFVKSQKGNDMLLFNGYLHKKERCTGSKIIWKCSSYNKRKCPGRIHTQGDELVKIIEHDHDVDPVPPEPNSLLKFVRSQKGNNMLHLHGYLHKRERVIGDKIIWKCALYNKCRCPGRVHTQGDEIVKIMNHSHVSNNLQLDTTITVTPSAERQPDSKTVVQKVRRKEEEVTLARSRSEDELTIPYDYHHTHDGEPFLLYDSGPGEQRILIFSTEKNLKIMAGCEDWYTDGAFKWIPHLFSQLYTIHADQYGNIVPTVYALLSDKREETYIHFLQELKRLHPELNPKSIMTDFECPAVNAFRREFPDSHIRGCFTQFTHHLWRSILSVGLGSIYKQDPDFALHLKQLAALPYVPEDDVIKCFEQLLDSDFYLLNETVLTPLVNIFEDTWIGRYDRRGYRRPPLIPLSVWNQYNRVKLDLPRTNKIAEDWDKNLNAKMNATHPTVWDFIKILKAEEAANRVKAEKFILEPTQLSKKQFCEDLRIRVDEYEIRPVHEYLRGIACIIHLPI